MTTRLVVKAILLSLLGLLLLFLLVAPILVYWLNFKGYGVSDNPSNWGVFGDYIGGVLNPFIAFLNLGILIYLTVFVSREDTKKIDLLR